MNPVAHRKDTYTIEEVLNSRMIADPLTKPTFKEQQLMEVVETGFFQIMHEISGFVRKEANHQKVVKRKEAVKNFDTFFPV